MNCNDLTRDQFAKINESLFPGFNYLARLSKRLDECCFPPGDPLRQAAHKAHAAMQELTTLVHYRSCRNGIANPQQPRQGHR